jgi:hypothetical protein
VAAGKVRKETRKGGIMGRNREASIVVRVVGQVGVKFILKEAKIYLKTKLSNINMPLFNTKRTVFPLLSVILYIRYMLN